MITLPAVRRCRSKGGQAGSKARMAKKKKVRVDLRKNRTKPPRKRGWTRGFQEHGVADEEAGDERVRAKGDLSRRRTIIQDQAGAGQQGGHEAVEMPSV